MFRVSELIEVMREVTSLQPTLTRVMEVEQMTPKGETVTLGVYRDFVGRYHFRRGNGNYIPMASYEHAREYVLDAYALLDFKNNP